MGMLEGKKILVGITGSIAAYKTAHLVRLLTRSGAQVRVVMTPGALEFITPLTLSTLSGHPVHSDFTENKNEGTWVNHVQTALWADLMVIAPLSANTLARMATGQCENFLMAVYMSTRCPVMVAPAMDHDMWLHGATQKNIDTLIGFGHRIIEPGTGSLASGLTGAGRMAEPEEILQSVVTHFHPTLLLVGKKVLVTAGPTYERLDPVRFIGNFSTGKMGFSIAENLANQGAQVSLIYGPGSLTTDHPNIRVTRVESASDMARACFSEFPSCDIAVLAAAVADYTPTTFSDKKIKKKEGELIVHLQKTTDIARQLGTTKKPGQVIVGFALETNDEEQNARAKLHDKNFDLLVLNSLRDKGAGFGGDTNKITLLWPDNKSLEFGLKTKAQVAADIVQEIIHITSR